MQCYVMEWNVMLCYVYIYIYTHLHRINLQRLDMGYVIHNNIRGRSLISQGKKVGHVSMGDWLETIAWKGG